MGNETEILEKSNPIVAIIRKLGLKYTITLASLLLASGGILYRMGAEFFEMKNTIDNNTKMIIELKEEVREKHNENFGLIGTNHEEIARHKVEIKLIAGVVEIDEVLSYLRKNEEANAEFHKMKDDLAKKLMDEKFTKGLKKHDLDFLRKGGKIKTKMYEQRQAPSAAK